MNKTSRYSILSLLCIAVVQFVFLSRINGQTADKVVFSAMQHEIKRSMDQLQYLDYAKPCYISFTVIDRSDFFLRAELGSVFQFDTLSSKSWSTRLIVGSYEINDENFLFSDNSQNMRVASIPEEFPLENNYTGLRQSIWLRLDDIYAKAAKNHHEKRKLIDEGKVSPEMLSLPDFAQAKQNQIFIEREHASATYEDLKQKVRFLSNAYFHYPKDIDHSAATLQYNKNTIYFESSEGTRFSLPKDLLSLSVTLTKNPDKKEAVTRTLSVIAATPNQIPSAKALQNEVEKLIDDFGREQEATVPQSSYSGPVLLIGRIAAETLLHNLFDQEHSLVAVRNNMVVEQMGDIYFEEVANKWQKRVGERILPDGLNITALPTATHYAGVPLLGGYPVDSEGVCPPDSIVLVKNGILHSMLSSRTPTSVTDSSNGHYPYYFLTGGLSQMKGPSVLKLLAKKSFAIDDLISNLIALAKEDGLDYAYIVKTIPSDLSIMPYNFYRINVASGEQELMKNLSIDRSVAYSKLRKIDFSNDTMVLSTLFDANPYFNDGSSGIPVSYIGPSAVLLEEMKVQLQTNPGLLHSEEDYISNPLKRKK
jgi:hypothetical protein